MIVALCKFDMINFSISADYTNLLTFNSVLELFRFQIKSRTLVKAWNHNVGIFVDIERFNACLRLYFEKLVFRVDSNNDTNMLFVIPLSVLCRVICIGSVLSSGMMSCGSCCRMIFVVCKFYVVDLSCLLYTSPSPRD